MENRPDLWYGGACYLDRPSRTPPAAPPLPSTSHAIADSLSLPKKSTPVESSKSSLFCQNTRGAETLLCDLCAPISMPSVLRFFRSPLVYPEPYLRSATSPSRRCLTL